MVDLDLRAGRLRRLNTRGVDEPHLDLTGGIQELHVVGAVFVLVQRRASGREDVPRSCRRGSERTVEASQERHDFTVVIRQRRVQFRLVENEAVGCSNGRADRSGADANIGERPVLAGQSDRGGARK